MRQRAYCLSVLSLCVALPGCGIVGHWSLHDADPSDLSQVIEKLDIHFRHDGSATVVGKKVGQVEQRAEMQYEFTGTELRMRPLNSSAAWQTNEAQLLESDQKLRIVGRLLGADLVVTLERR